MSSSYFYDLEVYPNWNLAMFKDVETGDMFALSSNGGGYTSLPTWLKGKTLIGFNNKRYDNVVLSGMISGMDPWEVYLLSSQIINGDVSTYALMKQYKLSPLEEMIEQSIDLMQVLPVPVGLKLAGARSHCKTIRELPYPPGESLTEEQQKEVTTYCCNDLELTQLKYSELTSELKLRRNLSDKYKIDLMSSSRAQIAEKVIESEYFYATNISGKELKQNIYTNKFYNYNPPNWIRAETQELQNLINYFSTQTYYVNESTHRIKLPPIPSIRFAGKRFDCGIGGLHSKDCSGFIEHPGLIDLDVTSYYPQIILNGKYAPAHMSPDVFLRIYQTLVDQRVKAKNEGNKDVSDPLKIVINGVYGKTSERYSVLYDPGMTLHVTITGQLTLLMLAERLSMSGISVLSANTDGITIIHDGQKQTNDIIDKWQNDTGFNLESLQYTKISRRDVNSYIAFTPDGKPKKKGLFLNKIDQEHNPKGLIIAKAIEKFIENGTPVENTINQCTDITKFVFVKKVKGGAVFDEKPIGSVIRWILTDLDTTINYESNGNLVPDSTGAIPVMDLEKDSDSFKFLSKQKYIDKANDILEDVMQMMDLKMNHRANALMLDGFSPVPDTHKGVTLFDGDFSNCKGLKVQTGVRCGQISVNGQMYLFDRGNGWTSSYKTINKKTKLNIVFGGPVEPTDRIIGELPRDVEVTIFNAMSKAQRKKILGELA